MVNGWTEYNYDAISRVTELTQPPGTNEQDRIHYSYNDYNIGNEVTITDENDNQRKYTYDAYGRLSKVEMIPNNSEYTTEYQYNALGNLTQVSKKNGQYIITYIYDSMGRLIQKHDPNSGTTKYIYDDVSNLRFIQDANHAAEGNWVYNKYDDVNRLIEDGEIYDVNPTRADANNQTYPANGSWRVKRYYDYSYNGSTNPRGNLVRELISQDGVSCEYMSVYSYDKRGRITGKTVYKSDSPIRGLTISYEYDAQDNLIRITYPDGEQTVYNYNGLMLCDTVKTLGGLIIGKIHYDKNEKPDSIIMGDLGSTAYTYYARDWVENIYVKHGNEENSVIRNYFYDNVGNTTYEHREASTSGYTLGYNYNVNYSYDNLYRLTNENYSGSINKQISYSYDYLHNRKQITEDGITIQYMYYKNTSLLAGVGGTRYLNDKNGNLTHCSLYRNTYDYCNELIERRGKKTTTYSYDGKGNRVRQETIGGKGSYRFYIRDESGRVIFETDDTPNVLKNPHFENGDNWSPWLTYTPGGSCTWQVAWDQRRSGYYSVRGTDKEDWETFIQKVQLADCPIPFVVSVYVKTQDLVNGIKLQVDFYEGSNFLGCKGSEKVYGTNDWVQIILPIYNSDIPQGTDRMDVFVRKWGPTGTAWIDCFRLEGGIVPTRNDTKYIYVNNIHLARINWSDYIPFFYFCDALGTPMKISKVLGEYPDKNETFKAFGEQLTSSGSVSNTHRFTGKEYEASGIYYFGARYYDPTLGRFLTPDPLGKFELRNPRTINPYVYCTNNPLFYVDPDGRVRWRVVRIGALNVVTGGLAAVGGGLAVTAGVATTPIGGIGALKIVGGLAAIGWGTMEFGQGITNLTLGFADQEPINIPETIAGSIAGKKGVVAVKVGKLTLGLTTPTAGGVVSNEAVKMIIKAIEAGSTIQEINELGEELGIDIESSFENLPPIEPMKDPMEKIREEMGRKKEFD